MISQIKWWKVRFGANVLVECESQAASSKDLSLSQGGWMTLGNELDHHALFHATRNELRKMVGRRITEIGNRSVAYR
jgi:hypothetical protein